MMIQTKAMLNAAVVVKIWSVRYRRKVMGFSFKNNSRLVLGAEPQLVSLALATPMKPKPWIPEAMKETIANIQGAIAGVTAPTTRGIE